MGKSEVILNLAQEEPNARTQVVGKSDLFVEEEVFTIAEEYDSLRARN